MRTAYIGLCVVFAFLVSCGPSASQLRMKRVSDARAGAQLPGPRQAAELAMAVHYAKKAGDYKEQPQLLQTDTQLAIQTIDRALPAAGMDAAHLIALRAMMLAARGEDAAAVGEFRRSFDLQPNELAGRNLIEIFGIGIRAGVPDAQQGVATICQQTYPLMRTDDDRLDLIAHCRKNMNGLTPETEMSWMTQEQIAWYQAENARRMQAEIDTQNARAEQQRQENRVVHRAEQCFAGCKERGLMCMNRCGGDRVCEDRCVQANHACVDGCEAAAKEQLQ